MPRHVGIASRNKTINDQQQSLLQLSPDKQTVTDQLIVILKFKEIHPIVWEVNSRITKITEQEIADQAVVYSPEIKF